MKKSIEITLETAKKWYKKGGDLKELALTAFTEKELDDDKIEWDYNTILEKFEKKYPIGTVVWSNEGTDIYPNVIVSKPYLKDASHLLYNIKKHIVFDTKRILMDEVRASHIEIRNKDEFEQIEIQSYIHPDGFDYEKWKESRIAEDNRMINHWKGIVDDYEKQIVRLKKQILEYENEVNNFDTVYNDCLDEILTGIYLNKIMSEMEFL